ncbi:MAG TPA: hypothetical protein VJZ27_02490, partial [Aggregatilineales bacterium]|nr:hypothetical protein [Aggregatilineales bacterium]
ELKDKSTIHHHALQKRLPDPVKKSIYPETTKPGFSYEINPGSILTASAGDDDYSPRAESCAS